MTTSNTFCQLLDSLLRGEIPETIEVAGLRADDLEIAQRLNTLVRDLREAQDFVLPLSKGELAAPAPPPRNKLASPFKELQSQLRHLTWQAEQVARGDYGQRIDFMGELGSSFNNMVDRLLAKDRSLAENIARLTDERQRFRRLFDQQKDAVLIVAQDDRSIVDANPAAQTCFGYDRKTILTLTANDLFALSQASVELCLGTTEDAQPHLIECTGRHSVGCSFPVEISIGRFVDGVRNFACLVVRDCSERKAAEQQLSELLDLDQKLLAAAPIGVGVYHAVSGQCVRTNDALGTIVGASVDQILAQVFRKIPSWKESGLLDRAEHALQTGEPGRITVSMRSSFGKDIWISCHLARFTSGGEQHLLLLVNDITDRYLARQALQRSEQKFRLLAESATDIIWMMDESMHFTYASPAILNVQGYEPEEALSLAPERRYTAASFAVLKDLYKKAKTATPGWQPCDNGPIELETLRKDGTSFWGEARFKLIWSEEGSFQGAVGITRDISVRKSVEAELVRLATTDSLTGIPNRRHFLEQASLEFDRSKRYRRPLSLLMIDIDHFKTVNDTHGHPTGDDVIRALARQCVDKLRRVDRIGRIGGEEFAALLPETSLGGALLVAERLRETVATTVVGADIRFTISLGVAELAPVDSSFQHLLKRADVALFEAKAAGRNRVVSEYGLGDPKG